MKLIKIRFTWQLHELFDEDFTPAKSPITEILKQGDPVVFDTSLEPANLHRFTRTHKFPLPVFKFLEESLRSFSKNKKLEDGLVIS